MQGTGAKRQNKFMVAHRDCSEPEKCCCRCHDPEFRHAPGTVKRIKVLDGTTNLYRIRCYMCLRKFQLELSKFGKMRGQALEEMGWVNLFRQTGATHNGVNSLWMCRRCDEETLEEEE